MPTDRITVVNIVSVSYSGSTWMNLMLGSTPESFSVGEIKSILRDNKAECTIHGEDCPLWTRYEYPGSENPFVQLAKLTGKRVLVVNNSRKFLQAQQDPRIDAKFIHLMRDGRAASASFMRKFEGASMWRAARWWQHDVKRNLRLLKRQPREAVIQVIYEQLKADPNKHLPAICDFIGLPYNPDMIQYWNFEHHFLGGNPGTLLSMVNQQDKASLGTKPPVGNWDLDYYKKSNPAAFKDERWKSQLSDRQLRQFALIAGRLNRRFGYSASTQRSAPDE